MHLSIIIYKTHDSSSVLQNLQHFGSKLNSNPLVWLTACHKQEEMDG